MKAIVVFYSRTGSTRMVADAIGEALNCDTEEIRDRYPRLGLWSGWWRSIREARQARETEILPTAARLSDYDLVVLGTPVWASSMSSPLRTWLNRHRHELANIAVFVTEGGRGGERAIAQIAGMCGTTPLAELVVTSKELATDTYRERTAAFAASLLGRSGGGQGGPATPNGQIGQGAQVPQGAVGAAAQGQGPG